MPTLWAHTNYFATSDTVAPTPLADSQGGYPRWQASNVAFGSLWGGLQGLWDRLVWWLSLWRRVKTWSKDDVTAALDRFESPLPPPQPDVVHIRVPVRVKKSRPRVKRLLDWARQAQKAPPPVPVAVPTSISKVQSLLEHPAYPFAQEAVRKTAVTLGFNRPEAWQGLSRHMKSSPGRAENTYRHMNACQMVRETAPSTLSNPDCNLLVELAYHEFAMKGR